MDNSILQTFLNNRFIKLYETESIDNIKKASGDVQKLLSKKKAKVVTYTLVALDPTISDDDPTVQEVEAIIIKRWSVFRNSVTKTKDKPVTYIQAVILDALAGLSKNEVFAAIIWHTGCNIVSQYKLAGQEEVIKNFLLEIGKKVETIGQENWSILKSTTIDPFESVEIVLPNIASRKVSEDSLNAHLKAASGQATIGGENPQFPSRNDITWSNFFAQRAAKGLSDEINSVFSAQNKSLTLSVNSIQKALTSYLANFKPHLEQVSSTILLHSKSLNKRSDLIWWKQTLYSPTLDKSYRSIAPISAAVAMAVDLAINVSPIYPKRVDFFLKETLRDVLGDETDAEIAINELLSKLEQLSDPEKQLLEDLFNENQGRKALGAGLAELMQDLIKTDDFFKITGLGSKATINLGDLSVWLFHDLQANKLVNAK